MSKFEQLLDLLVNEEHEKANELFHEIVVEKSRTIYENLIAEEEDQEDESVDSDEEDEAMDSDEDESVEEGMDDMNPMEMDDMNPMEEEEFPIQDKTDDFANDMKDPMADDDMSDSDTPATQADVQDLEDALEELKAEFEKLVSGEKHEEEEDPDAHGGALDSFGDDGKPKADDDEEDDEEDEEDEGYEEESYGFNENRKMTREYREQVAGYNYAKGDMHTDGEYVGGHTGEIQPKPVMGKSPVNLKAESEKPTSKANAHNIAQGGLGQGEMSGTKPNGKTGGLVPGVKGEFTKGVEKNIASSATAKMKDGAALNKQGAGYPGNNKGGGVGAVQSGEKAGQTSLGSQRSIVDRKQP